VFDSDMVKTYGLIIVKVNKPGKLLLSDFRPNCLVRASGETPDFVKQMEADLERKRMMASGVRCSLST
jgi:hypothetical protein